MKICTAVAKMPFDECLNAVSTLDFVEIRLDLLELSEEEIIRIFSSDCRTIATCRPGKYAAERRRQLLLLAITSGASYVDIEVDADDGLKHELIRAANAKGCQVIISFHDFEKTPQREELERVIRRCSECHADIIKVACMVSSPRDNARLLGLLDSDLSLLVVGMGEQGRISRVAAPLLGGLCTFASFAAGKATAAGQMRQQDIEELWQHFERI
ncbi:hypothetical protein CSB45_04560 [candidate division KSB3 bacterium]|uniref:3-dehydroquinate dehydratase n=1 Tax=candidate division KSB3 bacterium TaxID=2044937 RepID=A0A2G6E8H6_9BACT|nr:MAG: hypothetical protein CSB45_04560 [candidate division KSB3 bacterium]PIE30648.1 MAG: hypothetical protein CSA57_03145 [candidate division KSB3 bacterium]